MQELYDKIMDNYEDFYLNRVGGYQKVQKVRKLVNQSILLIRYSM